MKDKPHHKFAKRELFMCSWPLGVGIWVVKFHTLITWWKIDTKICVAHPPADFANYLWN